MSLTKLLTTIILSTTVSLMASKPTPKLSSLQSFAERAKAGEHLSVVFFGGSLTYGANASDPLTTSWRGRMMAYLTEKYPEAHFAFHDATIGGTGSTLGLFRLERDVLKFKPDLVFLDFTMNDGADGDDPETLAAYEHLFRALVSRGIALQPVITTFKYYMPPAEEPNLPRVNDHLKLAKAYHLTPANIHHLLRQAIAHQKADPAVLWPFDQAHPDDPGYQWFFDIVRDQFEKNIADGEMPVLPAETVFEEKYPQITRQILADSELPNGWTVKKTRRTSLWFDGLSSRWMTDLVTAQVKDGVTPAPLEVKFHGSLVGLFGERDSITVPFKVWIDGEPIAIPVHKTKPKPGATPTPEPAPDYLWKIDTGKFSPPKANSGILFNWVLLAKNLKDGEHTLRIEPIFEGADPKADLRIESVCSAGR